MDPIACQLKTSCFDSLQMAHKYSLARDARISRMAFDSSHQPLVWGAHGLNACGFTQTGWRGQMDNHWKMYIFHQKKLIIKRLNYQNYENYYPTTCCPVCLSPRAAWFTTNTQSYPGIWKVWQSFFNCTKRKENISFFFFKLLVVVDPAAFLSWNKVRFSTLICTVENSRKW